MGNLRLYSNTLHMTSEHRFSDGFWLTGVLNLSTSRDKKLLPSLPRICCCRKRGKCCKLSLKVFLKDETLRIIINSARISCMLAKHPLVKMCAFPYHKTPDIYSVNVDDHYIWCTVPSWLGFIPLVIWTYFCLLWRTFAAAHAPECTRDSFLWAP
jgi:hypothetical protein